MNSHTDAADGGRDGLKGFVCVLGATILWSIIPVCLKFALNAFDAYTITWMRFAVSCVIMLAIARPLGTFTPLRGVDLRLALIAAAGIGWNYVCYLRGMEDTTASAGNVVVQFEVVSLVVFSRLWLKESIGGSRMAGMLVTFVGVGLVLWNGEDPAALVKSRYFFGNMLIFAAAPLWGVYGVCQKILAGRGVPVSSSLAYIFGIATVLTLPAMLIGFERRGPVTLDVAISLAVLIVFSTAGSYGLMAKGLEYLEASIAGMVTCLLPIFTIIAARIFLGEAITPIVGAGAALVVLGLLVIAYAETGAPAQEQDGA